MTNVIPFKGLKDIDYLIVICQLARDEPEKAMDHLSKWLMEKGTVGVHRSSFLCGLIQGAILRQIHTDAISHRIPSILRTYGRPTQTNP